MNTKNAIQQAEQGGVNTPVGGDAPLPRPQEKAGDPQASLKVFSLTLFLLLELLIQGGGSNSQGKHLE